MKALIVYESMFGCTRVIAESIGQGLAATHDVSIVRADDATDEMVAAAEVLVVGAPTHAHGLPGRRTREAARGMATKDEHLTMDPHATHPGLREWFHDLGRHDRALAFAFDTRAGAPALFTGRASKALSRRLRAHGFRVSATKSFVVDKHNHLLPGEPRRAFAWGEMIGTVAGVKAA